MKAAGGGGGHSPGLCAADEVAVLRLLSLCVCVSVGSSKVQRVNQLLLL